MRLGAHQHAPHRVERLREALREVHGSLRVEFVKSETANERRVGPSVAIDSNGNLSTGSEGAYPSVFRVEFVLSASDRCFVPVGPTLLSFSLQTRREWDCQWLLTTTEK